MREKQFLRRKICRVIVTESGEYSRDFFNFFLPRLARCRNSQGIFFLSAVSLVFLCRHTGVILYDVVVFFFISCCRYCREIWSVHSPESVLCLRWLDRDFLLFVCAQLHFSVAFPKLPSLELKSWRRKNSWYETPFIFLIDQTDWLRT